MAKRQVWLLAQSEGGTDDVADGHCKGLKLNSWLADSTATVYPAYYHYQFGKGGRTLVSYWMDGYSSGFLTGPILAEKMKGVHTNADLQETDLIFLIDHKNGVFDNLCLFYDGEGDPNLNVAAWEADTGVPLRPTIPVGKTLHGDDKQCPIEKVVQHILPDDKGSLFSLSAFTWDAAGFVRQNLPSTQLGAWNILPGNSVGILEFHAKKMLTVGDPATTYEFVNWEFNSLNPSLDGPQTVLDPCSFAGATFAGLVAYYKVFHIQPGNVDKTYKPAPTTIGDPPIRQLLILTAHRVAYDVEQLAKGIFRTLRHDPETAEHGTHIGTPTIDADRRDRLIAMAKAYPNDRGELEQHLNELHR